MTENRMTHPEAVVLCRFAKACCPQQTFDEYTPDAWFELLKDLRFEDCKEAIVKVVRSQPFVSPSEIREAVGKVRWNRIVEFGHDWESNHPPELADRPDLYAKWRRETYQAIADGLLAKENYHPPTLELVERDVAGVIEGTFRSVDDKPEPGDPGPCTEPGCDDPWCDHGMTA